MNELENVPHMGQKTQEGIVKFPNGPLRPCSLTRRTLMGNLFGEGVVAERKKKLSEEGLDAVGVKDVVVVIVDYFEGKVANIESTITSINNAMGQLLALKNWIKASVIALWSIFGGLLANLLVALLAK